MANDRCPWCGAEKRTNLSGQMRRTYQCRSVCFDDRPEEVWRSTACHLSEAKQLRARVTKLEAALQRIADENPPLETVDDWESKYASDNTGDVFDAGVTFGGVSCGNIAREALSDTHGPGTIAGDAAREGLKR